MSHPHTVRPRYQHRRTLLVNSASCDHLCPILPLWCGGISPGERAGFVFAVFLVFGCCELFVLFESESHHVALAGLELTM